MGVLGENVKYGNGWEWRKFLVKNFDKFRTEKLTIPERNDAVSPSLGEGLGVGFAFHVFLVGLNRIIICTVLSHETRPNAA